MAVVNIIRYVLFGKLLFFSLIILALSGHIMSQYASGAIIPVYLPLCLAVAVITMAVVIPSLVVDFFRKGAFTSMIAVEIGWVSVLMVLWVAAAGEATASLVGPNCGIFVFQDFGFGDFGEEITPKAQGLCGEARGVQALSWLSWLIMLGWLITIITLSAVTHSRGNSKVWTSPVTSVAWGAHHNNNTASPSQGYQSPSTYATQPAMVQQHSGYPQGYPPQQQQGYNTSPPPTSAYSGAQV